MRPVPVDEVANTPEFVSGLSVIRGIPTPLISLASLMGSPAGPPTRFVVIRVGERQVALAVDAVLAVCELDPATLNALPSLIETAAGAAAEAIGILDGQLLLVLNSANIVPDEIWDTLVLPKP